MAAIIWKSPPPSAIPVSKAASALAYQITVRGIPIHVARKKVKNLRLTVLATGDTAVRLTAPLRMPPERVHAFLSDKIDWIQSKQAAFQRRPAKPAMLYQNGEMHRFLDDTYPLVLIPVGSRPRVALVEGRLVMSVLPGMTSKQRESLLYGWYRQQLYTVIEVLIEKWQAIIGEKVNTFGIKRMKTRWGTCNPRARRIWLGLDLATKPLCCLEYVVVHEMVHLLEASHNKRFQALMDSFLQEWRDVKKLL
ncbi:MAG: M48 family metallopeptidase [Alphaproteobacteria bacterium]|jgi:predicted metal-dependent hydrolase|nr:M48 family metallopeptidase [Alphaproteobacteria bacterium]